MGRLNGHINSIAIAVVLVSNGRHRFLASGNCFKPFTGIIDLISTSLHLRSDRDHFFFVFVFLQFIFSPFTEAAEASANHMSFFETWGSPWIDSGQGNVNEGVYVTSESNLWRKGKHVILFLLLSWLGYIDLMVPEREEIRARQK